MYAFIRLITSVTILNLAFAAQTWGQAAHKNLEYARVGERRLLLDIYLPNDLRQPPLVVWIHGGAWHSGDKEDPPRQFADAGFALASVDYRLSGEARFPAQLHDIKAAIRFLRAHADRFGYSAERIAIGGDSAGGHLAALVGVTNGHKELEGNVGEHPDQSSAVQAIVDCYGPTNLTTILSQSTPHGLSVRVPALEKLLGDSPDKVPRLARLASPVLHVDRADPPLLIFHGDQDPQVPINQSHELVGAYERAGLPVKFVVVHGAAHGGDAFFNEENWSIAEAFLRQQLNEK